MSRTINNEVINPAKHFLSWKSDKKCFEYYDKEKINPETKEHGVNVEIKLPFKFLVLDTLSTIKGWSDADQSGFWSNEVRDIKAEPFSVKTKKGECAKGLYENIMAARDMTGARYCQSVYIMMKEGKEMIMANIQIIGAALGQWIEFRKKNKIFTGAVEVKTCIEGTKGKTVYNMPVFTKIDTTPETNEQANKMDSELQEYLSGYFKNRKSVIETEVIDKVVRQEEPDQFNDVLAEGFPSTNSKDDGDDLAF